MSASLPESHIMQTKKLLAAILVSASMLGVSAAHATPISGSIMFSDTFAPADFANLSTTIVSGLTAIPVDPPQLAQACIGSFSTGGACIPNSGTFANTFTLADPLATQALFTYNGFTFTMTTNNIPINVQEAEVIQAQQVPVGQPRLAEHQVGAGATVDDRRHPDDIRADLAQCLDGLQR